MKAFVWPRYRQELLPPSWGNIWDIETKNKWQRNQIEECIKVSDNTFKKPRKSWKLRTILKDLSLRFLCWSHQLSVDDSEDGEDNDEQEEFPADEFVQWTLKSGKILEYRIIYKFFSWDEIDFLT